MTEWITSRPPTGSAASATSQVLALAPPPKKMASGAGNDGSDIRAKASPTRTSKRSATPKRSALPRARAARSLRFSKAMVRVPGALRHQEIPMLPDPVPMSHSTWPRAGANAANANSRIGCFVSCPSLVKESSDSSGPAPTGYLPVPNSMATTFRRGSFSWCVARVCAVKSCRVSRGVPRLPSTVMAEVSQPAVTRIRASFPGVV